MAACGPADVPDSAAGVGFGDYETYLAERQARDAQLAGLGPVISPEATGAPRATPSPVQGVSSSDLAAAGIGAGRSPAQPDATGAVGAPLAAPGVAPVIERAAPVVPVPAGSTRLSDEQDFGAVAARETIESDAARLERQRAAFTPIAPQPLPERSAGSGPDIVAYALSTTQSVGQQVHRRTFGGAGRAARACARYPGDDVAQRAFLEAGGPQRDRLGLDPDGDGFACGWNPAPFRAARG